MFDGRWRNAVDRSTAPVGQALHKHGITADVLTATGLISAIATAVAVATGHLLPAIGLLTLTGLHDLFDGPVAKASGTASVRGAFFDSIVDRMVDAVLMGGVAWYLVSNHRGHLVLLPLAVLGVTSLISYERAKAEALGLDAKGGLMERAERMILLGVGFIAPWLLVPILWVLLGLTSATAVGRFVRVWQAAEGPPSAAKESGRVRSEGGYGVRSPMARWREGGVDSRWRSLRQGATPYSAGTDNEPVGRWRARRQEPLSSRSGRARQARRKKLTARSTSHQGPSGGSGG